MANTGREGSATFPTTANDVYSLVETLAVQNIRGLKSANKIIDGFYEYDIQNGKVVEEAVIQMAEAQAYNKNAYTFAPTDPVVKPLYFNNFEEKQFKTTIRRDDIRTIIANKGVGVEDVVSEILESLTQGEGNYDFTQARSCLYNANFKDYYYLLGGRPLNMKGVLYALRDMYNHLRCNNSDLTNYAYVSATPEEDIRIAISPKLMNLIDVKELASIFNLEKEQLFGKIVLVDVDDLTDHSKDYYAYVYDRKALGRATRILDYTQDIIGIGRFTNHYLTTSRAYFHNGLFKGCFLDCSYAAGIDKATIVGPTIYTLTQTLTHCTSSESATTINRGDTFEATFTPAEDYTFDITIRNISVKVGGTELVYEDEDGNLRLVGGTLEWGDELTITLPNVSDNLVVKLEAI